MRAHRLFVESFRYTPTGEWSAPGRVNLIGEHTDYSGGLVLPFAIEDRAHVAVARRDDRLIRLVTGIDRSESSIDALGPGAPLGWPAYLAGAAWALRDSGHDVGGFDLALVSDVPMGAGLSSSAALMSATLLALADLHGLDLDRVQLASLGRRAENVVAGVPCGAMDHMASLICTHKHAMLLDTGSGAIRQVALDPGSHGLRLMLLNTGHAHVLSDGRYAERRAAIDAAAARVDLAALEPGNLADALTGADDGVRRAARHVVTENARVRAAVAMLDAGDFGGLGPLLDASHASLRDDLRVSSPELDSITSAARGAGALGARLTGAGFGGCAIALVPLGAVAAVTGAAIGAVPGASVREVAPAAGARRDG